MVSENLYVINTFFLIHLKTVYSPRNIVCKTKWIAWRQPNVNLVFLFISYIIFRSPSSYDFYLFSIVFFVLLYFVFRACFSITNRLMRYKTNFFLQRCENWRCPAAVFEVKRNREYYIDFKKAQTLMCNLLSLSFCWSTSYRTWSI